jgi:hypothetical protein
VVDGRAIRANSLVRMRYPSTIASSVSHLPIVDADASQTPRSTTKRCSSERLKRESGTPWSLGNSHAIALTWATSSGGKTARAPHPRPIPQTLEALFAESSPPPADSFATQPQPSTNLGVGQAFSGHQHQLGALDLQMRARVTRRDVPELRPLSITQHHLVGTATRHQPTNSSGASGTLLKRDGIYGEHHLANMRKRGRHATAATFLRPPGRIATARFTSTRRIV